MGELEELRGAISEIYILSTSCVSKDAPIEVHKLAGTIVRRIIEAGYDMPPSWYVHDWEQALWEEREAKCQRLV